MSRPQKELPNPFVEHDKNTNRLTECEIRIEELERTNQLLMQSITMLMKAYNAKISE